jgi:hypothetical protein
VSIMERGRKGGGQAVTAEISSNSIRVLTSRP